MRVFLMGAAALCLIACSNPSSDTSAPVETASINADTRADMPGPRPMRPSPVPIATSLKAVSEFETIVDQSERSVALFGEVMKVVGHPRCMNCHPVDGPITQGDDMVPHQPMVARGEDTFGNVGMRCGTCHGDENVDYVGADGSMPGHAPWHTAPKSMGWQGLSVGEICAQLKDEDRNGGRTLADLHEHNAEDGLVGWGWTPGKGRTPAPGTQAQFGELTQAWIDTGAVCPT